MKLTETFLSSYRARGDQFPNLLARSTYLGKYSRSGETWTDTVRRVVEGNTDLDSRVSRDEAEKLFHAIWSCWILPPGRGLWTGGVPGMPVEARYNCWLSVIRSVEDWCWVADMLMCGGGVGVSLLEIDSLPVVAAEGHARLDVLCSKSHPNVGEVMPDDPREHVDQVVIEDSRAGWVEALRLVLSGAFEGRSVALNVSSVRPRGAPIRTFGGIACGPGPLAQLVRSVWAIVRGAKGRRLTSVEALDITNHVGVCIKSGNVRRSALIVLGRANDVPFRRAKHDEGAILSHRHSSNNSIVFEREEQIDAFDWRELVEENAVFGEPGILNLWRIRQSDPGAMGVNPCGEIPLHDREACNLAEFFPAKAPPELQQQVLKLLARYSLRQRLEVVRDEVAEAARVRNMRIGVGLGGICDFAWTPELLGSWRSIVREAADSYADELGVNRPNCVTTVKPSGTISLLAGSSPGVHAPYAPYYLRRTRISLQEPMAIALAEAGVPCEPCVYDKTGNTLVFAFPMTAPSASAYVTTETVRDQVERQVAIQEHWADNAVSTTITFKDHEKEQLADLLRENAKRMKSISCLPAAHGYAQPPYQEISRDEYDRMTALIHHDHPLTAGGDLEVDECATGACPVR